MQTNTQIHHQIKIYDYHKDMLVYTRTSISYFEEIQNYLLLIGMFRINSFHLNSQLHFFLSHFFSFVKSALLGKRFFFL